MPPVASSPSELSATWVLYRATSPSGKAYFGVTGRVLDVRQIEHRYQANSGSNRHFANALRKYGSRMVWEVLVEDIGSRDEANDLERASIALHRSSDRRFGYNLTEGGEGVVASGDTRAKMSASAKARGVSEKQLANLEKGRGDFWVGRRHLPATIQKMRDAKIGVLQNDEARRKRSESHRARVFSDEHRCHQREANLLVPDSERRPKPLRRSDGLVFDSMSAAARGSNMTVAQVRHSLKTGRPTKQGFTFTRTADGLPKSS